MKKTARVTEMKRRKPFHLGVLIFLIILIYILINIYLYMTKPKLSIYEVQAEELAQEDTVEAVIVRAESIIKAPASGYVNYYLNEGNRVAKLGAVYSLDESKKIYETLSNTEEGTSFLDQDITDMKDEIKTFRKTYKDNNFFETSNFKNAISTLANQMNTKNLLENLETLGEEVLTNSSFQMIQSSVPGTISYQMDSLSGLTLEMVEGNVFDTQHFEKISLRTNDLITKDTPVYRIITEELWYLIAPISEDLVRKFEDQTKIRFSIQKDKRTITAPIELYQDSGQNYIKITMQDFMLSYMNERYLEITFQFSEVKGLKIPLSSITKKAFFLIPSSFLTENEEERISLLAADYDPQSGKVNYKYIPIEVYYEYDGMSYIDTSVFELRTILFNKDTKEEYTVGATEELEGVFNVNKGYSVFRRIERLRENEDYCIVSDETSKGITLYDHIALDASTAIESAIIY